MQLICIEIQNAIIGTKEMMVDCALFTAVENMHVLYSA